MNNTLTKTNKPTVLFIDDENAMHLNFEFWFWESYKIQNAHTTTEAIWILTASHVDDINIIVSDVQLEWGKHIIDIFWWDLSSHIHKLIVISQKSEQEFRKSQDQNDRDLVAFFDDWVPFLKKSWSSFNKNLRELLEKKHAQ